ASAGKRLQDTLSKRLDSETETRLSVLRQLIDNEQLYKREYNSAFILVHYFGYFRRNPDDPPDSDMEGFNYWLGILNRSGDYRSLSRAFLESEEYQNRR